jgi:hypothetical protein
MTPAARRYAKARTAWCRHCGAKPGFPGTIVDPVATAGRATASRPHQARLDEANRLAKCSAVK